MDIVKSPVAVGFYSKNAYDVYEYPRFKESVKKVVPVTKYGFAFVNKKMNETKKNIMSYFCEWMIQQQKNISMALSFGCLPVMNEKVSTDAELIKTAFAMYSMNIDIDDEEIEHVRKVNEKVLAAYLAADEVVDFDLFEDDRIDKITSKIVDYVDACQHKIDGVIDYKDPDNDIVGTMYTRKAFDNWVNYFDL